MALSKIKANSITDDSITADQIADNAVHGRRNLIINGAMKVAQRATSATTVSGAGVYDTIDRLKLWESTGGAWTSEQSTEAPDGFEFSTKLACTTADTSIGAAEYAGFGQTIEANDLAHLAYGTSSAKPITVSFYIRSNKTGTYCLAVDKNDNTSPLTSYNFVKEFTIDSADTWERKVITVQPDSQIKASAGAIAIDNGVGFQILVGLAWGSDYSGATDNTWSSSDLYATNNQVNWLDSTSNNLYFTGFQLEVGDKATPFEHRSYGEELQLCRRYFQVHDDMQLRGNPDGALERIEIYCPLGVPMRANPSKSITTTGNSSNIRSPATTYAGFLILRKEGCVLALESNNSGLAHFDNRTETLDAEL